MNTSKKTYMCQKRHIYMSKQTHIFVETVRAVCASQVLQHAAVCCSMLQSVPCAAVSCSVLQCVAVWGSVLQCVAVCCTTGDATHELHRLCSVISTLFSRQIRMCPKKPTYISDRYVFIQKNPRYRSKVNTICKKERLMEKTVPDVLQGGEDS